MKMRDMVESRQMNQSCCHAECSEASRSGGIGTHLVPDTLRFAQGDQNHQKGFTLMEVLVVMTVGGMIMAAGLLSMYQVIWGTARTNDQVSALTDANLATMWLKFDIQMFQDSANLIDGGPTQSSLTMTWTDLTTSFGDPPQSSPVNHTIQYALSGTNLVRTFDGTPKTVGRNITTIGFTRVGDYVNVSITATGPGIIGRTQTLGFSVYVKVRTEA